MATDKKYGQENLQDQPHSEFETSSGNNFEDVAKETSPNDSVLTGGDGELPDPESIKLHGAAGNDDGETVSDLEKPKENRKPTDDDPEKDWSFRGNK